MKSSIFIPKKINVGYQSRSGTYTGKLAYVIYYDEKGKLRKETSWNGWRDSKIPNEEFDNTPTSGFVLNKKVGDYDSGWNHRMAYCRIYDPRNFEFEITIENLLYILENTNSIKGKGLEGDFVYGWDGKDLVLIPTTSPDYIEMEKYNNIRHNNLEIKNKDLLIGATYIDKDSEEYIYMGKFNYYDNEYIYSRRERSSMPYNTKDKYKTVVKNKGKYHFFAKKPSWSNDYRFEKLKSVSKKFISCIDEGCHNEYASLFDKLERNTNYSPLDSSKYTYEELPLEEFINSNKWDIHGDYCMSHDRVKHKICRAYDRINREYLDDKYVCHTLSKVNENTYGYHSNDYATIPHGFKTEIVKGTDGGWYSREITVEIPVTLEEIYDIIKPIRRSRYLENGKFYDKEMHWNE